MRAWIPIVLLTIASAVWAAGRGPIQITGGQGAFPSAAVQTFLCPEGETATRTTSSGAAPSDGNNTVWGPVLTTGSNSGGYTVDRVDVYVETAAGNVNVAIYTNDASATLVCNGTGQAAATGWLEFDMSGASCGTLSASTAYRVVANTSSTTVYGTDTTTNAGSDFVFVTYNTWNNPQGSWTTSGDDVLICLQYTQA